MTDVELGGPVGRQRRTRAYAQSVRRGGAAVGLAAALGVGGALASGSPAFAQASVVAPAVAPASAGVAAKKGPTAPPAPQAGPREFEGSDTSAPGTGVIDDSGDAFREALRVLHPEVGVRPAPEPVAAPAEGRRTFWSRLALRPRSGHHQVRTG
ncbi:hypothetical protein OG871_02710 [Kitasatospora sp. NBC_00374]|uniref:hypothetical protein n=1 Tax=Kitasatospora sp. NBC_00374 TaxID=2975964 RepID=UPI0030E33A35